MTMRKKPYKNIVGKEENAGYQSPFPTMFSTLSNANFNFLVTLILSCANAFNSDQSEILSFSTALKVRVSMVAIYLQRKRSIVTKGEDDLS